MKGNKLKPIQQEDSSRQRIRFTFTHPTASRVCIAGTFNAWRTDLTPMVPMGNGHWMKELVLPPGTYEYRLLVDGAWSMDPQASEQIPNPFGGLNSVLKVAPPPV